MPFQSEKQRRYMHANLPEIANRWERDYANGGISNHFRRRVGLKKGSSDGPGPGGQGARGQATQNPGVGGTNAPPGSVGGGGGGQGGGQGGQGPAHLSHNAPKGPTIAEIDAQKKAAAAAANEKKLSRQQKYESDKQERIRQKRIKYMLDRRAKGKGYGQKNLNLLTMGSKPGFYGNVPTYDPLATRNVGISALDNVSESMLLPREKPDMFPDYSGVGTTHPFIMNRGTTIQGTRPPDFVAGIPQLGPIDPGSAHPAFTNRGLTEELSTKDYTSEGPYWSQDETGKWISYDADGNPIDDKPIGFIENLENLHGKENIKLAGGVKVTDRDEMKKNAQKFVDMYKEGKYDNLQLAIEDADRYNAGEKTNYEITTGHSLPKIFSEKLQEGVETYGEKVSESEKRQQELLKEIGVAEGGLARKNYYHGGILDINESEEIISDDGNDIELTDYNAAFDEPTGVQSLFPAKDGGRIGFANGPPGGGETSLGSGAAYSGGASDRGPRDDPDRHGPVSKPQTVPSGINIHGGPTVKEALRAGELKKMALDFEEEKGGPEYYGLRDLQNRQTELTTRIQEKITGDWKRYMNPSTWEKVKNIYAFTSISGVIKEIFKGIKRNKDMRAFLKDLEDIGLAGGPPGTNDPLYDELWLHLEKMDPKYKKDDDTGGDGPEPIYAPLTGAVDEGYAQGDYGRSLLDRDNAALFAQLSEGWRQEKLAKEQEYRDYGLLPGDDNPLMLQANSGGLANLFRVKNQ